MTSIGYFSAVSGSGGKALPRVVDKRNPGGAIRGFMPQQNQTVDKSTTEFENIRFTLRQAWNTNYNCRQNCGSRKQSVKALKNITTATIITPFRAINNAGDILSRVDYTCGGPCQTFQSRPGLHGLRQSFGSVQKTCVPSAIYSSNQLNPKIPAAACNVKYVYDSSVYTTYLKQKATFKNFNDISYGGDNYHASQSAMRAIRRY